MRQTHSGETCMIPIMSADQSITVRVLIDHVEYCFQNIHILFSAFTDEEFELSVNGFPIWQQFYHTLNSMDRILTDPVGYTFPSFHEAGLNELERSFEWMLPKKQLEAYFAEIETTSRAYLASMEGAALERKSRHSAIRMTKLDHLLAQMRHMTWHIGYLHSCAKVLHGQTPEHILVQDKQFPLKED